MLTIAVLVSPAAHPVSGKPIPSVCDAAAFELACSLVPEHRLTVLYAGSASEESLDGYLGLGASTVEILKVEEGLDIIPALQSRLQGVELILCGVRSDGQYASGLLPYLLAEGLQVPLANDVLEAKWVGRSLHVRQFLPKGMRRQLEVNTPAILTVHPRAHRRLQYAYARARAGRFSYSVPTVVSLSEDDQSWQTDAATRRPQALKAKVNQSGHGRMLGAIGGEAQTKGALIVKDGDAMQKASAVLSYLRQHHLVDF